MKRRQPLLHALLVLLLIISQQFGFAHAVSHLSDPARHGNAHHKHLPSEHSCPQCLSFAQLGSALPPLVFRLPVAANPEASPESRLSYSVHTRTISAFRSRAPPL